MTILLAPLPSSPPSPHHSTPSIKVSSRVSRAATLIPPTGRSAGYMRHLVECRLHSSSCSRQSQKGKHSCHIWAQRACRTAGYRLRLEEYRFHSSHCSTPRPRRRRWGRTSCRRAHTQFGCMPFRAWCRCRKMRCSRQSQIRTSWVRTACL